LAAADDSAVDHVNAKAHFGWPTTIHKHTKKFFKELHSGAGTDMCAVGAYTCRYEPWLVIIISLKKIVVDLIPWPSEHFNRRDEAQTVSGTRELYKKSTIQGRGEYKPKIES
jgi:hypothetical protein